MGTRRDALPELDVARLDPSSREIWDTYCTDPLGEGETVLVRIYSFGQVCMFMHGSVPKVVAEYLREHDPEDLLGQYLENVRQAHERRKV